MVIVDKEEDNSLEVGLDKTLAEESKGVFLEEDIPLTDILLIADILFETRDNHLKEDILQVEGRLDHCLLVEDKLQAETMSCCLA